MHYEWDEAKNQTNQAKHGVAFEQAERFEWDFAITREDTSPYGEARFVSLGPIGQKLYCLVYTLRGDTVRVISLRRATKSEHKRYAET